MISLRDWYTISTLGEDLRALDCPKDVRKAIQLFQKYENSDLNEWEIQRESGLLPFYTRRFRKFSAQLQGKPVPKITPLAYIKYPSLAKYAKNASPMRTRSYSITGSAVIEE